MDPLGTTGCLWGNLLRLETASLSTPAIDLLLMILDQINMHDIEWLCLSRQTVSHLHAVHEFSLIDPAALDLYLFVNASNWVYLLSTFKYSCLD